MKRMNLVAIAAVLTGFCLTPADGFAQGKGKGGGQDKGRDQAKPAVAPKTDRGAEKRNVVRGQDKAVGRDISGGVRGIERRSAVANAVANGPKNPGALRAAGAEFLSAREIARYNRDLRIDQVRPEFRRYAASNRAAEFLTGGALAYAMARGLSPAAFLINPANDAVQVRNRSGNVLFLLNDDQARSLGAWQVAPLSDNTAKGAPSFCRSGAGHPVWGRQWCIDKGFGLGTEGNVRWGRTRDLSDLSFNGDYTTGALTRDALLGVLGPVAFNRLALHALTLGLSDPLVGNWRTDSTGQRLLLVSSGRRPVAEIADFNNDRRADLMLVALRPW